MVQQDVWHFNHLIDGPFKQEPEPGPTDQYKDNYLIMSINF